MEKWSRWSNTPEEIDRSQNFGLDRFTLDQLLSNVMLYWTTGTITSSMRLYFECMHTVFSGHEDKLLDGSVATTVPVGIINHRKEVSYTPRAIARAKYPNIKLWEFHQNGGHFGSMELPKQYYADVQKFLSRL